MNPLCCIAPVSIDRERSQVAVDPAVRTVNSSSKLSYGAQVPSVGADLDRPAAAARSEEAAGEGGRDSKVFGGSGGSLGGILYKWVNYGKGWRARWFVLEDGVLSYYKVHGPDKIVMSPAAEKSVRVIGEESLKFVRKASWRINGRKQCRPFGEVHLKYRGDEEKIWNVRFRLWPIWSQ
ncbi:hypothetical protein CRG98_050241 [Punica granatum]|uniref:PH domain-containing protein n=1 Tax=Punica granatum TaxID=22663 RepID=A0A2I0GK33_PUNGR|nr:hypothetical protein CRG98_050241 [Punica granatum]